MAQKHCNFCKRNVETKRQIGIGTLLLCLITAGFWLLLIPFYRQRCSICKADNLNTIIKKEEEKIIKKQTTKQCNYCAEEIKKEAILCRFCGKDQPQKNKSTQKIQASDASIENKIISAPTANISRNSEFNEDKAMKKLYRIGYRVNKKSAEKWIIKEPLGGNHTCHSMKEFQEYACSKIPELR